MFKKLMILSLLSSSVMAMEKYDSTADINKLLSMPAPEAQQQYFLALSDEQKEQVYLDISEKVTPVASVKIRDGQVLKTTPIQGKQAEIQAHKVQLSILTASAKEAQNSLTKFLTAQTQLFITDLQRIKNNLTSPQQKDVEKFFFEELQKFSLISNSNLSQSNESFQNFVKRLASKCEVKEADIISNKGMRQAEAGKTYFLPFNRSQEKLKTAQATMLRLNEELTVLQNASKSPDSTLSIKMKTLLDALNQL
ncbi:hypothetical protein [Candidatus Odyssella acanthamoebae]|uniref:Uncharacterized protein n=1 Tax=Candidatus Odyssella acanthamoebae TaxID=91604 RepID=A0A077AV59_9PROT|nr:hypothetical protein [Candidatus Paracaedibacter acanthamoebae]AIK95513.1 hypothetical protein ID47_00175 [Candidatus Paracaedibacter acanthamoebae]